MNDRQLHQHLIGQQGARGILNTPVLIVDLDPLHRNIQAMAAFAAAHGIKLRPHSKTHKSADIGRLQIAAGAIGLCCAKLGEAEALAEAGLSGLLITSPVVGSLAIQRLAALNRRMDGLMVVADNGDNVDALAEAAGSGKPLSLLVDIDPGSHRTGTASPEAALALARRIAAHGSLRFAGVQFYCGRQQHIESYAERRGAIAERTGYLRGIVAGLAEAGLKPAIITGGGTGTHEIDADLGLFTELQVGSYVFMDDQYAVCGLRQDGSAPFETALLVDSRVVSANTAGLATIDAGLKAFATEAGAPSIVSGAPAGSTFRFTGDEHGAVIVPEGTAAPRLGEVVSLTAPHCDPTVNLYESYHVVRGDTLVDIWPVTGRGRSR